MEYTDINSYLKHGGAINVKVMNVTHMEESIEEFLSKFKRGGKEKEEEEDIEELDEELEEPEEEEIEEIEPEEEKVDEPLEEVEEKPTKSLFVKINNLINGHSEEL